VDPHHLLSKAHDDEIGAAHAPSGLVLRVIGDLKRARIQTPRFRFRRRQSRAQWG
jgi:hypothetical protein